MEPTFSCGDISEAYEIVENVLWELFKDFLDSPEAKALVEKIMADLEDSGKSYISGHDINEFVRAYFNTRYS